jgi:hypothetical protein
MSACEILADKSGRCFKLKQRVKTPRGTLGKIYQFRQSGNDFGADIQIQLGSQRVLKFVFLENILTI